MGKRRLLYILLLLCSVIFYWAYQKWLGWLLLVAVLCLPVLSLVLSLPALFGLKMRMTCPETVLQGDRVCAEVTNRSWFPAPLHECSITVCKPLTKSKTKIKSTDQLSTAHCGKLYCRIEKVGVSDYLGLFQFRLGTDAAAVVTVRPSPVTVTQLPELHQKLTVAWQPKPGGGFAENHEVRLYRPGDNLNQIHWKLSAKTGKLVIREPMIPVGKQAVVGLCLCGSDAELDVKFGRLLGICNHLQEMGMTFDLQAVTGRGVLRYHIGTENDLTAAIDELLGMEPAEAEQVLYDQNARVYWIGGDADEK